MCALVCACVRACVCACVRVCVCVQRMLGWKHVHRVCVCHLGGSISMCQGIVCMCRVSTRLCVCVGGWGARARFALFAIYLLEREGTEEERRDKFIY